MIWLEYIGVCLGVWFACGLIFMVADGYFKRHH